MIATEICAILAAHPVIGPLVGDYIMDMDYRATQWENAINYEGKPLTIVDKFGYMKTAIVVDDGDIQRSPNLRGAGRHSQIVNIWVFTPRGAAGTLTMHQISNEIYRMHEMSLPSRPMLMLSNANTSDDGKNLYNRIQFSATFIPAEAGELPPHMKE